MLKRVISAIVMAAAAFVIIYFGGLAVDIAAVLIAAVAVYELFSSMKQKGHQPMWGVGVILLFVLFSNMFDGRGSTATIFFGFSRNINLFSVILLAALLYALCAIVLQHKKYSVVDGALSFFGAFFCVYLLNYFVCLRDVEAGAYMLILAIIGCVGADTAAFFIGCKFGKKKLIPDISPKKTVAGSVAAFAGGLIACTAYGLLLLALGKFPQFPIYHYIIIGLLLGGVAQIGDLAASAIKRYCGVKDFGNLIPGHGGILDRIDAYLIAVPIVYYYYAVFITSYYS